MLLDDLIVLAENATPPGFETAKISWVLCLKKDGTFIEFKKLDEEKSSIVPKLDRQGGKPPPNTGIDNLMYLLGVGDDVEKATWRHTSYKEVLATIDHPAARAVERFLVHPDRPLILPDDGLADVAVANRPSTSTGPQINTKASCKARPLIEVEGYPEWWASEAVRSVHAARIGEDSGVLDPAYKDWPCSLCGKTGKPLARKFPKSTRLGSRLVSFNEEAFCGYGRSQGLVAPTCMDCATATAIGLDFLAENGFIRYTAERIFLWWNNDLSLQAPWELFDVAVNPLASDVERKEAIEEISKDSRLAILEKNQGRLALRYYNHLSGTRIRQALERWSLHLCTAECRWSDMTKHPLQSLGHLMEGHQPANVEYLYRSLLGGDDLPHGILRPMWNHLSKNRSEIDSTFNRKRLALLRFANKSTQELEENDMLSHLTLENFTKEDLYRRLPFEEKLSPSDEFVSVLGRMLARCGTIQRRNSPKVKDNIVDKLRSTCIHAPLRALTMLDRYGNSKNLNNNRNDFVYDQLKERFVSLGSSRVSSGNKIRALDPREQMLFENGIFVQRGLQRMNREATEAKKAQEKVAAK